MEGGGTLGLRKINNHYAGGSRSDVMIMWSQDWQRGRHTAVDRDDLKDRKRRLFHRPKAPAMAYAASHYAYKPKWGTGKDFFELGEIWDSKTAEGYQKGNSMRARGPPRTMSRERIEFLAGPASKSAELIATRTREKMAQQERNRTLAESRAQTALPHLFLGRLNTRSSTWSP
jgi:hypothetical protein